MNACAGETNEERGPPIIELQGRRLPEYRLRQDRLGGIGSGGIGYLIIMASPNEKRRYSSSMAVSYAFRR